MLNCNMYYQNLTDATYHDKSKTTYPQLQK